MAAISYPLTPPTAVKAGPITFTPHDVVSESRSPFTGAQQTQVHQGQWWTVDVQIRDMSRADAEDWIGFLMALKGRTGSFLLGDPAGAVPRGIATGTPLVDGGSQTGDQLNTKGWTTSQTGILLLGDYIQLGSGSSTYLHKVIEQDVNSDGSGDATLRLWPNLRASPSDNDAITVTNTVGHFKLVSNDMPYAIRAPQIYTIAFVATEVL